ncbi:hypothetical protein [Miniimonas sp. S16]|uniref:hypothetical protein n=1 Tax=Miniimonas sp. S16 TaxID=2171623 RepID=UPI000D525915|nr:hypothetical protein [Miniimonas sp. S16]
MDQREAVRADLAAFDAKLATKLASLISDGGLSARDAQALLEIDAAEVKRLRSLASAHEAPTIPAHNGEPTRAE